MLIVNAKCRQGALLIKENHHILPKCMGGNNDLSNIVSLTPREHFVAHHLLWKMYRTSPLHYAFWLMVTKSSSNNSRNYIVTSRTYEIAKTNHAREVSITHTGRVRSEESKRKSSISLKGKAAWNKGLTGIYSDESIRKMSAGRIGFIESDETRKKKSDSAKKRDMPPNIQSDEAREKRKLSNEKWRVENQLTCPHCNKIGISFNMKRYHLNNCKLQGEENLR